MKKVVLILVAAALLATLVFTGIGTADEPHGYITQKTKVVA